MPALPRARPRQSPKASCAASDFPATSRPAASRLRRRWAAWGPASACGKADRKSTRLNSSHANISYAVFCLKKKKKHIVQTEPQNIIGRLIARDFLDDAQRNEQIPQMMQEVVRRDKAESMVGTHINDAVHAD